MKAMYIQYANAGGGSVYIHTKKKTTAHVFIYLFCVHFLVLFDSILFTSCHFFYMYPDDVLVGNSGGKRRHWNVRRGFAGCFFDFPVCV